MTEVSTSKMEFQEEAALTHSSGVQESPHPRSLLNTLPTWSLLQSVTECMQELIFKEQQGWLLNHAYLD